MRVVRVAMLVGVMMVPVSGAAWAQSLTPGFRLNEGKQLTEEEIARNKRNEDDAKAARATIPNAKVSSDPWAAVRTEPAAKTPKAKTSAK